MIKYVISISVLIIAIFGITETASADNCGSLSDCYLVVKNAAIAGGLIAIFIGLGLDFTPISENIKGIIDALNAQNTARGQTTEWWEKVLNSISPTNSGNQTNPSPRLVDPNQPSSSSGVTQNHSPSNPTPEQLPNQPSSSSGVTQNHPLPPEAPKSVDSHIVIVPTSSSESVVKTILILAANPRNTSPLRLGEEVREIDARLQRARKREQFDLKQCWALRISDLCESLVQFNPQIVHFTGHGKGDDGLVLENEMGNMQLVNTDGLAELFKLFATKKVECVVLNACYSEVQATEIAKHIPYVIGMNKAISDEAAIKFATGFYSALGAGESVEFAYKLGCIVIQLDGNPEHLTPVLKKKESQQ